MSDRHLTIPARRVEVCWDLPTDGLLITHDDEPVLVVTGSAPELAVFASNVTGALHGGVGALARFTEVWGSGYLAEELGSSLNCAKVNALVALLDASGRDAWLRYHLLDCDDRDEHRPT